MKKSMSIDSQATTPPSSISSIIDEEANNAGANAGANDGANDGANAGANDGGTNANANITIDLDNDDADSEHIALMIDKSKDQLLEQIKGQLLDEFKDLFTAQQVDKPLLIKILIRGMEIIESTSIKGKDQKDLVIDVLIQILETDGLDISHKDQLIQFLKEDANTFIDVIVDASKGKININKVESVITVAIKYLFTCFKKK